MTAASGATYASCTTSVRRVCETCPATGARARSAWRTCSRSVRTAGAWRAVRTWKRACPRSWTPTGSRSCRRTRCARRIWTPPTAPRGGRIIPVSRHPRRRGGSLRPNGRGAARDGTTDASTGYGPTGDDRPRRRCRATSWRRGTARRRRHPTGVGGESAAGRSQPLSTTLSGGRARTPPPRPRGCDGRSSRAIGPPGGKSAVEGRAEAGWAAPLSRWETYSGSRPTASTSGAGHRISVHPPRTLPVEIGIAPTFAA